MKKVLVFAALLASPSCKQKDAHKHKSVLHDNGERYEFSTLGDTLDGPLVVYYPNGKVKLKEFVLEDVKQGQFNSFYQDGTRREQFYYVDGYQNGPYEYYYADGKLKQKGTKCRDMFTGDLLQYYPSKLGSGVESKLNIKVVNHKEWKNGYITFNTLGDTTEVVEWLVPSFNKPYCLLGDSILLTIKLLGPKEPEIAAYVGEYDSFFNNVSAIDPVMIKGYNHSVKIWAKPKHIGRNSIRGFVSDYRILKANKRADYIDTWGRTLYFGCDYLCRK